MLSGYFKLDNPGIEDNYDAEEEINNENKTVYNNKVDLAYTKADEVKSNNDNI